MLDLQALRHRAGERLKARAHFKKQLIEFQQSLQNYQPSPTVHRPLQNVLQSQPVRYDPAGQGSEEQQLRQEKSRLIQQLAELERQQRSTLEEASTRISTVKDSYMQRIKAAMEAARLEKQQHKLKLANLQAQISNVESTNNQVIKSNAKLQEEVGQTGSMAMLYANQIEQDYAKKLMEFEQVFLKSSERIKTLESQVEDEQLITSTLNNPEIIESLRENAGKAAEDIDRIHADYLQLLQAKTQILKQLTDTNEMKQRQVQNCSNLEQKIKTIIEKLNQEKQLYVAENQKMTAELLQIKKLMESALGGAL